MILLVSPPSDPAAFINARLSNGKAVLIGIGILAASFIILFALEKILVKKYPGCKIQIQVLLRLTWVLCCSLVFCWGTPDFAQAVMNSMSLYVGTALGIWIMAHGQNKQNGKQ